MSLSHQPAPHSRAGWLVCLVWLPPTFLMVAAVAGWSSTAALIVSTLSALAASALLLAARSRRHEAERIADLSARLNRLAGTPSTEGSLESAGRATTALESLIADRARALSHLQEALNAVPHPLIATDGRGVIRLHNRAALEFFDRDSSLAGTRIDSLFTQAEILSQHAAALLGRAQQSRIRVVREDGFRILEVGSGPAPFDDAGKGAVLTLRDITELAQASQLKTDFVANASHELRTPLSSIRAAVETLEGGAKDDPAMIDRLARMISTNATRLEELVNDLLDLSRLESPEAPILTRPTRLAELCSTLADDLALAAAERNLRLEFEIDPAAEVFDTDPKLLTLILRNLLENATKFAYEATAVRLVAEPVPATDASPPAIRLRIIDRVVGIPFGHQQRIFERFFQVDPSRNGLSNRRGTGLGLAIVKHAVKRLGGTISVESVWKEGTTMTVDLPARSAPTGDPVSLQP